MSALMGSKRHGEALRYVVFDAPVYLSPLVEPCVDVARRMMAGDLEGLVLKDRTGPYRDGSRAGWWKVKDHSWYEREAWRFDRR